MGRPLLFVTKNGVNEAIQDEEIVYFSVSDNYVEFKLTDNRKFKIRSSLQLAQERLPAESFCRIHRSYVVRLNHVRLIGETVIMKNGDELPIGREHKAELLNHFECF
ncbi:LytR/AlgR family response regulator transcription factor [Chitinophaga agri]|uniref:LytTR family transcriptional regulator n=1 Tax=Chitinophaga agri TaxID=2703787 RepID=A0A6B9ZCD3_9BACT|nr:LytTR family DNA-binding domain-containing protein [Chitinophaga agri]QHS58775.1 LytTR family transcriptional regulator [Chitinophaga agri]